MDINDVQLLGGPCGQHGPYTFYKAFKYTKRGVKKILTLSEFFFVKMWRDSDLVCIGELQLLWTDKNSEHTLASLRLYFLPENTPEGRMDQGEDDAEHQKELKVKWKHIEKLEEELDNSRTSYTALNSNLKRCLESDKSNINTRYVKLKEKHESVHKEIEALEKQLEKLKVDILDEKEKLVLETDQKIKAEEELGKNKILEIKARIEKRKTEHTQKIEQLNNELELARAATDLEQDDIETTLRRELINVNMKIWRKRKANDDLQIQIDDLRSRLQKPPSTTHADSIFLRADDLSFFQLEQLDDLFQRSLTDTIRKNTTASPKEQDDKNSRQAERQNYQKILLNNDNVNASHQTVASKYQQLPIIRSTNQDYQPPDNEFTSPAFVNDKNHNIVEEYQTNKNAKEKSTKTGHVKRYNIEEYNLSTDSSVIFLNNNGSTININTRKGKTHQEKAVSNTLIGTKIKLNRNPVNADHNHNQNFDNKTFLKQRKREIKTGNKKQSDDDFSARHTDMSIFKYPNREQSDLIQKYEIDSNKKNMNMKQSYINPPVSIKAYKKSNQPKVSSKNSDRKKKPIENTKEGQTVSTTNKNPNKKRKLFNVNDLDYLDSIQIHSDQ